MSEIEDFEDRKHPMIEGCQTCVDVATEEYAWPCGACGVQDGDMGMPSYFKRLEAWTIGTALNGGAS